MRLRLSILLLSVAAAACTAESTTPLAGPAVSRNEAPADTAAPPPNPNVPDSKGSIMPVVGIPADSKGSVLPSI